MIGERLSSKFKIFIPVVFLVIVADQISKYFAQKYLLDDPFNKFPNFKLAHSEDNLIVSELKKQGVNLNEFVYYQGIQGPIKIWEIKYSGNEEKKQEYLDRDASKYLSWEL